MKAAVLIELNAPLEICDVELTELQVGQVLVKVLSSGICGSQLQEIAGNKGNGKFLPHLMGHEGSGLVEEIGPGVTRVKPGDKVVMHWRPSNGIEATFPIYMLDGKKITSGKVTTLSEKSIVSENRLTVVPNETPDYFASLLGCGLTTALGIVNYEAEVKFGESVLVAGCGGVGLNLIQAASLASAFPIVGIDINKGKETLAKSVGAHHFTDQDNQDLSAYLEQFAASKQVDVAIDTTGNPEVIAWLSNRLSNRGRLILVGQPKPGSSLTLPNSVNLFGTQGKKIISTQGGRTDPTVDIPKYVKMQENSMLEYTKVITHTFELVQINDALETLKSGTAGRIMVNI